MDGLWMLIDCQQALEDRYANFLASLDPSRTVTLRQLLTSREPPEKLQADWLRPSVFTSRMAALGNFIDALPRKNGIVGWNDVPLVFFQAAPPEEDQAEHDFRVENGYTLYARARFNLPPQTSYLIGETNWMSLLTDTPRGRVVPALHPFSNRGNSLLHLPEDAPQVPNGRVLGYRLPNYPALLGRVGGSTATNYVARIVGHDIGHAVLPGVDLPREELHNVTMLNAMFDGRPRFKNGWEQMISDECCDPLYFLRANRDISRGDAGKDPLRRHIVNWLLRTYVNGADERQRELWGIDDLDMPLRMRRKVVQRVLLVMRADAYAQYAQPAAPTTSAA